MGLIDKIQQNEVKPQPKKVGVTSSSIAFTKEEILIVLKLIQETNFKGSDITKIYNLINKLENKLNSF
jgi:hypothetical protein